MAIRGVHRRFRLLRRGSIAALTLIGGLGLVAPTAGATAQHIGPAKAPWTFAQHQRALPLRGELTALSCPTSGFCVALDQHGNAFVEHGSTWSVRSRLTAPAIQVSVSCPTTHFCMATSPQRTSRLNGTAWTHVHVANPSLDFLGLRDISCTSHNFCMMVGDEGYQIFNGTSWSVAKKLPGGDSYLSVSCASATMCVAGNEHGQVVRFNGSHWSTVDKIFTAVKSEIPEVAALSCPTTTFCLAGADNHSSTWNGHRWSAAQTVVPGNTDDSALGTVACLADGTCVGGFGSDVVSYQDGAWSAPYSPTGARSGLSAVSCQSATSCQAVGAFQLFKGGVTTLRSVATLDNDSAASALSCASRTFCVVMDNTGHVAYDKGSGWSKRTSIDNVGMFAVSCVSSRFCVALDGVSRVLSYNGKRWTTPQPIGTPTDPVDATAPGRLSCPVAGFCAALTDHDAAIDRNGTWTTTANADAHVLEAVSCASRSFCIAVDKRGNAIVFNGKTWSTPKAVAPSAAYPVGLDSVSCPTKTFCAAGGSSGAEHAVLATYNGKTWSAPRRIHFTGNLTVSCDTPAFCLALNGLIGLSAYAFDHGKLVGPWATDPNVLNDASPVWATCPTTHFCATLDSDSNVDFAHYSA